MDRAIRYRRAAAGFTLVELLIVIVVATILIGIAVPTYQQQMRKSRRTEAKTILLDAAAREERFYATQNRYSQDTGELQYTAATGAFPYAAGTYYQINAVSVTQPTSSSTGVTVGAFSITVTPLAGSAQLQDSSCQSFTVTQTGVKTSTDSSSNDSTSTCWP